jgi:hypothetical protein
MEARNGELKAMILPSDEGQEYAMVVLYPGEWDEGEADRMADGAFAVAKRANPHDWQWADLEAELVACGFTIPPQHHGGAWDGKW